MFSSFKILVSVLVYQSSCTSSCQEIWFKDFMSDESVGLSGYCCERTDRVGRVGAGVACYVAATVPYDRLLDIEDNEHEVMWIRLRLHKLPRIFASIVIACIYHPPNSDNSSMREYIIATLDGILRRHPDCGIILIGDFNQLRDMFLRTQYGFAQLVNTATRKQAVDQYGSCVRYACRSRHVRYIRPQNGFT